MTRWLTPLFSLLLGIALGLVYGWIVDPVEYVDTTPDSLRLDYRADFVLSVAEAYQSEQDPDLAARRLAVMGSQPPGEIAGQAMGEARSLGFAESDLLLMQKLTTAMQAWQPSSGDSSP